MRVLVQRVSRVTVTVDGDVTGAIGPGLLLFVGFTSGDGADELAWMLNKCSGLRIFPDDEGRMNRSVVDVGGECLVISQFTLYGNTQKGFRPSFMSAAPPDEAQRLYDRFVTDLSKKLQRPVAVGRFGAHMLVDLVNDGPVTLMLER